MSITVFMPTSWVPSCPSTEVIDQTIVSLRNHLPDARLIVACDGLKEIHQEHRPAYAEYCGTLKNKYGAEACAGHMHQSRMFVDALKRVDTPYLLFLEHDWELGFPIEWGNIIATIKFGEANYVKFHAGDRIHPLHEHMMFQRRELYGSHFIQTVQYSANPHLASVAWYRSLLPLLENKTDFVENLLHGPIACSPWEQHKLMVYNPVHGSMQRAIHLDGRKGEAQ